MGAEVGGAPLRRASLGRGDGDMRRAYVFRLRPTARQHVALAACVEAHRELYNAALEERREAWSHRKTRIRYGDQSAQLTEIRSVRPDHAVWSFSSQQATLRRLNKAFEGFSRRVKRGEKAGFPRFKGTARFASVEWPKDGDGARWLPEQRWVYLQGIGEVKVHQHRQIQGRVKTIQIKRQGRHWLLVLSCEDVPTNPLPVSPPRATGHIDNPRWGRAAADALAAAQQRLARAKRRSKSRERKRETVGARHRKIANMLRRAKPVLDPENPGQYLANGARAKSGLSRSISGAGWGRFVSILCAKAEEAGRIWIEVDPRHTSDRCENCGHAAPENRVTQAEFRCTACGHSAQADEHAARNLLRAGLALHAQAA
jgi:putative transposase